MAARAAAGGSRARAPWCRARACAPLEREVRQEAVVEGDVLEEARQRGVRRRARRLAARAHVRHGVAHVRARL
ncbi:unnamed protein product [Euphydryas editha]|uniref:Uncharacterized protein n=1 Tax=Euphydryas editha TaxID=104508 RepID=A0AAU9VD25_EUPED|nr:unnamed protein product [Euphydryas editha]